MQCYVMSSLTGHTPNHEGKGVVLEEGPSYFTNSELNYWYSTTKGADKIHLNRLNTNLYRSMFEFMGAQAYNSIPREIRNNSALFLSVL